jgi:competence protein ComEA
MTALFMRSVSRWSISLALFGAAALAQLPAGPGKAETEKLCGTCHEVERSIAPRQDRAGWKTTIDKMVALGANGSEKEFEVVLDYLSKNYPAPEFQRLNVNTARAIELESTLGLPRSQAAKVIEYREKNGPFKSINDLKKVPGVDVAKIEAKKDRLAF